MHKLILILFMLLSNNSWTSECGLDLGKVLFEDKDIRFTYTNRDIEGIPDSPTDELIKIEVNKSFTLNTNPNLKASQNKKFLERSLGNGEKIKLEKKIDGTGRLTYKVVKKVIGSINFSFTTNINSKNKIEMIIESNGYSHGFIQTRITIKNKTLFWWGKSFVKRCFIPKKINLRSS